MSIDISHSEVTVYLYSKPDSYVNVVFNKLQFLAKGYSSDPRQVASRFFV